MKKRSSRKSKSFVSESNLSLNSSKSDASLCGDQSGNVENENPNHLKVVLPEFTREGLKNFQWIKSNYKNIILLNPSTLRIYNTKYVFVKGEKTSALCIPYPLKSVKPASAVFPTFSFGLNHSETVQIYPYHKNILEVSEIKVDLPPDLTVSNELSDRILGKLSRQFICTGMKIRLNFSQDAYDIIISELIIKQSSRMCILCSSYCDQCRCIGNETSFQLQSAFTSMSLDEKLLRNEDSAEEISELKTETEISTEMPQYFIISHETSIIFNTSVRDSEIISHKNTSQLGGLKEHLHFIKSFANLFFHSDASSVGAIVLHGPSGTGKSLMLQFLCNEFQVPVHDILWYQLYSESMSEAERDLGLIFQKAKNSVPCIILIDQFNYLCPSKKDAQSNYIGKVMIDLLETLEGKILILASTNNSDYDDTILNPERLMLEIVKFTPPSASDRLEILNILLRNRLHYLTEDEIKQCVLHSNGFTGGDLEDTLDQALMLTHLENSGIAPFDDGPSLSFSKIKEALKLKKPSLTNSNLTVQKIHWSDIGGMELVKEKLKEVIEWPLKYPENFQRFNIKPSKGVLLYGPPGCSKTMIAKALATECDFNFMSKNASDLFNKYVGESEKAVRDLFAHARAKSPCIIFLDEIDALVAGRGSDTGGSGVGDRIVTTLLTEIDGIEELQGVVIVAATNRPDMLDNALMRNGRIDHFIYVPLPDVAAREVIFQLQMKNRLVDETFNLKDLALKTEGYSGAEIVNICNEAALLLLSEDPDCEVPIFKQRHFEKSLQTVLPRTPKEMIHFYEDFNAQHCKR